MEVALDTLIAPNFYDLHKDLKKDLYDEVWLKGGRGSCKSTFASIEIILGMLKDEDANAVICRRYQNELRDTVFGQFEWTIARMGLSHLFICQVSPMQIIYEKTGQKIVFKGADNPRKMKSINLGKGYIKYAWFEELDQFASFSEIRNIIQSLFRGEGEQRVLFFSYNPPKSGRSWVNQECKTRRKKRHVHHSDYRDVPKDWLGQRFLVEARHLKRANRTAYDHEYLGLEVGTGLEVFNNVDVEWVLTAEESSRFENIKQGLDFGYAAHPLCFNRMHFDKTRRCLYVFGEISGVGLLNRKFAELSKEYHDTLTIADSAEPKSIDELAELGMFIRGAVKGPGSVEHGIKFLQELEHIYIDAEACPRAANEFTNYSLEKDRNGEIKPKFPDKDNHSIDDIRYALEDDMLDQTAYEEEPPPQRDEYDDEGDF